MSNQFINLLKSFTKSSVDASMRQSKVTVSGNFKQSPVPQTQKALKFLYSTQQSLVQSQGLRQSQLEFPYANNSQVETQEQTAQLKSNIQNSQFYNSIGRQLLQSSGVQTDTEPFSQKSVQFTTEHEEQKPQSILLNKSQGKKFIYNPEQNITQQQQQNNQLQYFQQAAPEPQYQQIQQYPQQQYFPQQQFPIQQQYYQYQPIPYQYTFQPVPYIQINQPAPQYPPYPPPQQQYPQYQQQQVQQQVSQAQQSQQENMSQTAIFVQQQDTQNQQGMAQPSFTNTSLIQGAPNEQDESINQTLIENVPQTIESTNVNNYQSNKSQGKQIFSFEVPADELKMKNIKAHNQKQNLKQHSKMINKYMTKKSLQQLSQTSIQQKQSFVRQPKTQPQLIASIQKLLLYFQTDFSQAEIDYFMDYYKVESLARKNNIELLENMKCYEKNAVISTYLEYKSYNQLQFIYYIIMTQITEETWRGVEDVFHDIKLKDEEEEIKQQVIQLIQRLKQQYPQFIGKQRLVEIILQRYKQNRGVTQQQHEVIDLENVLLQ